MANPGVGYRTVNDLLVEISFHLLQPIVYTTLTQPVAAGPGVSAQVGSTAAMYVGAMMVVDPGTAQQEIVTVSAVGVTGSPPIPIFTATFANSHATGTVVLAATFPLQAATDALFTQTEMLAYLARAQNQFLLDIPISFQHTFQTVNFGHLIQAAPLNMVEMERVAVFNPSVAIATLTRTNNVVTAVSVNSSPHGFALNQPFSIYGSGAGWDGAFTVASIISPSSWTYQQSAAAGSTTGGNAGNWLRLYETAQEDLTAQNPVWRNQHITQLSSWFEDRAGNYGWGVNGIPASSFICAVLSSQRDTDTLALTDGFLVPDVMLHAVKYLAMHYAYSKEGECQNPLSAQYCRLRYDRVVAAARRWMMAMGVTPSGGDLSQLMSRGGRR